MVMIRLTRVGSKKRPFFRVVVVEGRSPRDGACVESLGFYNPRTKPESLTLNRDRLNYWLAKGAQASNTVRTLADRHKNDPIAAPAVPAAVGAPAS
jgi:small subunit ribosomal protein S16